MRRHLKNNIKENRTTANKLTLRVLLQNFLHQKCPLEDNSEVGNSEFVFFKISTPIIVSFVFMCWYDVQDIYQTMPFCSFFFSKSSFWYDVFLVLTQALTNDKPSAILFYFHQSLVHSMFRLTPWSHCILLTTEWKIIFHKKRQLWGQLSLSLTKFIVVDHKRRWKRSTTFIPQGLSSFLPLLPGFPSPQSSSAGSDG